MTVKTPRQEEDMKYSLMSLMIDREIRIKKPSFIQILIMRSMGYDGAEPTVDEMFAYLNEHGIPAKNGTMSFRDLVKFAKENGFDGLDMMSFHFEIDGKEAKEALDEFGITLSAIDIIAPFAGADTKEKRDVVFAEVKDVFDRGYEAGCRNFLVMPTGYTPVPGCTREQIFQNNIEGLRLCVEYAGKKGFTVNTETLESAAVPHGSIGEMLRIFDAVPGLKYSHDTGNPIVAMEDPLATYEALKDKVVAVHFKDLKTTEDKTEMMDSMGRFYQRADFGTGVIDFRKHIEVLKRDNYDGYITLEGELPAENQLESAKKALKYFKDMENQL